MSSNWEKQIGLILSNPYQRKMEIMEMTKERKIDDSDTEFIE
jgi:hypothetical protein